MYDFEDDHNEISFEWLAYAPVDFSKRDWLPNRCYAAQLAALVYDKDLAKRTLPKLGYSDCRFIDIESTQLMTGIHEESGHAIIVYEGTTEKVDWFRNFKFARIPALINGKYARIHKGFDEAGSKVDNEVIELLRSWRDSGLAVYAIGHSQGSALALRIALLMPGYIEGVYRIAPPRFGDKALCEAVDNAEFYNVYVGSFFDGVTWAPPWPLYRREKDAIILDPTRNGVVEVRGLRESWAIIIRWFYVIVFLLRFVSILLFPQTWWLIPGWWKKIRAIWSHHKAGKHYASQMKKLMYDSIYRGDYIDYAEIPSKTLGTRAPNLRKTGIGH